MRFLRMLPILVLLGGYSPSETFALADYSEQVRTIILFYEVLAEKPEPTVADFNAVFGKENKAELELILRQKFPAVDWKGKWDENKEILDYVTKVDGNPDQYPSRFLKCLKSNEPKLFGAESKRQVEFPPKIINDRKERKFFTEFSVITNGKRVVFQFVPDENTIENIYLPDGRTVYSLLEKCGSCKTP